MLTEKELSEQIAAIEAAPASWQNVERLAALYTIQEHNKRVTDVVTVEAVDDEEKSDFLKCASKCGCIWSILDELMTTLAVLQPRLYSSVMRKISE